MKLTLRAIENLTCPSGKKDVLFCDDDQRGLFIQVTKGAKAGSLAGKSFLAQYTWLGQRSRIPLGSCAAVSLAKARNAVIAVMGDVARGLIRRPSERKPPSKRAGRPRYAAEAVRALRLAFPPFLDLPAADLDRTIAVKTLDAMVRKGSAPMAAATRRYGNACYGWAVKRGALDANPFAGLPAAPTVKRERVLTDDELVAIWNATDGAGPFNGIVRYLILTGQRRDEVAGAAWAELSDEFSTWTIPSSRAKNGKAHIVPLSKPARDLLRRQRRLNDLLFPGLRGSFNGWSKAKTNLDTKSGVTDWRLHDLRRTCATGLQRLGVRLEVTEQILNHTSGSRAGVVGIYQRHDFAQEKRAALEAWGAHVLALVNEDASSTNVIQLRETVSR